MCIRDSRFPLELPDEATLIGARTCPPTVGRADWICTASDHWAFEGSGMRNGDAIAGLVGWEFHGEPRPDVTIISEGPTYHPRGDGWYTATVDEAHAGLVFNAATCWWADALSEPPGYVRATEYAALAGPDARVQTITRNVLRRLIAM